MTRERVEMSYNIYRDGRKVDTAADMYAACRVAEAFEEYYPDSNVEIKEEK